MTTLTANLWVIFAPRRKAVDTPAPKRPAAGPVLIHDCATAVNHSTLLHLLWRQADEANSRD